MPDPISLDSHRSNRLAKPTADPSALKSGGGDGTSGGMEARIARLESDMEHVKKGLDRLHEVPAEIAALKVRVEHLPSKGFIVTALGIAVALVGGITLIIERLSNLAG